jgi:hypothetical protein
LCCGTVTREVGGEHVDLAADEVGHGRRAALVGDRVHLMPAMLDSISDDTCCEVLA